MGCRRGTRGEFRVDLRDAIRICVGTLQTARLVGVFFVSWNPAGLSTFPAKILKAAAANFKPGQNELSIAVGLNNSLYDKINKSQSAGALDLVMGGSYKPVTDLVTGSVTTPSSLVRRYVENEFIEESQPKKDRKTTTDFIMENLEDIGWSLLVAAGQTFTNTLLSSTLTMLQEGIFKPNPDFVDPFSSSASTSVGVAQARQQYAGLLASNPISASSYSVLSDFVVCPIGNILVRGINNCVMDQGFYSAATRSSGASLTVQQAIKDEFLDAGLPLIPPTDVARNQGPLCYTYGYCYGNLVKLRKARIIPVGWELAAAKNDPSNPAKLGDIIDGFTKCNSVGAADEEGENKWCHLIDPNWVLKYPETQCRAIVNGEILSTLSGGARAAICVDTPSCVAENNDGSCKGAYGYCVREKNVWRFRGEACPEQYVSCLNFRNTFTNNSTSLLLNTVDYGICSAQNAGCRWYQTVKGRDTKGTATDFRDDTYEWLVPSVTHTGATYTVATEDQKTGSRIYFNNNATQCSAAEAGCSRVYKAGTTLRLNVLANPSFEDDTDRDSKPDFWLGTSTPVTDSAQHGSNAVKNAALSQGRILLTPFAFYTLSAYGRDESTSNNADGNPVGGTGTGTVKITFVDAATGAPVDLTNRSRSATCTEVTTNNPSKTIGYTISVGGGPAFVRSTCTFTTADRPTFARVELNGGATIAFDAIQLEAGETASPLTVGYNLPSPETAYLRLAPAYLNCTGAASDPKECANYTQVCAAQDIGCNRYTPENGGPPIPATISAVDRCPAECVGYTTYKQEATPYEPEVFPLHFIASKAVSCSAQHIGCDSYTNLDTVARGGEGVEHYTTLRACTTPAGADGSSATYFTWEGSDEQGYQLRTWQLLKSTGAAPCTSWSIENGINGALTLSCTDSTTNTSCDEHQDIFDNGDCREFYDEAGVIHYRLYSKTISVSPECHLYRKTQTTRTSCLNVNGDSHGYWTAAGECRYFGLPSESFSCPASADGCRAFTGGAGRNASVIVSEDFELAGSTGGFKADRANVSWSSESTASGGHSLRVEVEATATAAHGGIFTDDIGEEVIKGKTFLLTFWAKGSGAIQVGFKDTGDTNTVHDLVDPGNEPGSLADLTELALEGGWRPYTLGPLDTSGSAFTNFGPNTQFQVRAKNSGTVFYLDNLQLTQTEENITLIKNSWVVPASCDRSPTSVAAPQYFLGCQAYTDKDAKRETLYQFTRLCSDKVIGCQQFSATQNSNSNYGAAYNVRCENAPGTATAGTPVNVKVNTACQMDGKTLCTISVGRSYCVFNLPHADAAIPLPAKDMTLTAANVLKRGGNFQIRLGPEATLVANDVPMFLVDNVTTSCAAESVGCIEVGTPKYAQDKRTVTAFTSAYFVNTPESYGNILCENEELFCEEWASTKDGNFYFKDPVDQTCEYKTNIKIANQTYYGWFKKGTSDPCYSNNVAGGEQYGIWKNGDVGRYTGWVGQCERSYDRCTAFIDPTDTKEGQAPSGTQYSFIQSDAMTNAALQGSTPCNGVSRQEGCALFNNTNMVNLLYAAAPSYVHSEHADLARGDLRFKPGMVEAIDCSKDSSVTTIGGVDLCNRRCKYEIGASNTLTVGNAIKIGVNAYLGSCLVDADCVTQKASDSQAYTGKCGDVSDTNFTPSLNEQQRKDLRHRNDTNMRLKVIRDRACAEWLACSLSRASWNTTTNKHELICGNIDLCVAWGSSGDSSFCTRWKTRDPVPLTEKTYTQRDIAWTGLDYAGYSVPNVLPVELLDQVDVQQSSSAQKDLRLGYAAGACAAGSGDGSQCKVGFCLMSKASCANDGQCGGDTCVIGYCQKTSNPVGGSTCQSRDADGNRIDDGCSLATPRCALGIQCVDVLVPTTPCSDASQCNEGQCVQADTTREGQCFNGQCLTNIYGKPMQAETALEKSCRGYPEADSPFPSRVVQKWLDPTKDASKESPDIKTKADRPIIYVSGYQNTKVFSPVTKPSSSWESSNKPIDGCGYRKIQYGTGEFRYYPLSVTEFGSDAKEGLGGVCVGGNLAGKECSNDVNCKDENIHTQGTCSILKQKETVLGWPGYCLEYDSSILLYGSKTDEACLTWLPVDQLKDSTDLYGKFLEAGGVAGQ
ncbi:MAG: hypothetical protein UY77_C0031G0001, partial [Candidatus Uhrbacteria bacterium GW2011_GWA2_53_10]